MSNFKVGDIALGQNILSRPELNGMECTIIGEYQTYLVMDIDGSLKNMDGFRVKWANGKISCQKKYQLRKKYDGDDVVDWETCLWKPTEELA